MTREADRPVRCCVISPYSRQAGGAELSLLHLFEHGRGLGVEWSAAFLTDGPMRETAEGFGVPTCVLGLPRLGDPLRLPAGFLRLRRFVRDRRGDAVLGWVSHMGHLAGLAGRMTGAAAMWFQQGGPSPIGWGSRWLVDRPIRAVLANSVPTALDQARVLPGKPILVAHAGVDLARFDPAALGDAGENRRRLGLAEGVPLIGIVGRLQRWKGVHVLLRALPIVRQRHPTARALVVGGPHPGEPGYADELRRLAASEGVGEAVTFAGAVDHDLVPRHMQACDIMVHASHHEPFGIVVVEAMGLGKPTIASPRGGPSEVITDGADGLLVEPERPAELAAAIVRLLDDPTFAATLAEAGRRRAADFSVQVFARRVSAAVREAVLNPGLAPGVYLDGRRVAAPTERAAHEVSGFCPTPTES